MQTIFRNAVIIALETYHILDEIFYILGGIGKIDIVDWKANTRLKHCTADSPVVKWFWQIVESYSEEMRARLLQFVTGSSRVS